MFHPTKPGRLKTSLKDFDDERNTSESTPLYAAKRERSKRLPIWRLFILCLSVIVVCVLTFTVYSAGDHLGKLYKYGAIEGPVDHATIDELWGEFGVERDALNCNEWFDNDNETITNYTQHRITAGKEIALNMSCPAIRRRISALSSSDSAESQGHAVARNVYQSYYLQELFVAMTYQPSNSYCFAIDSKAELRFIDAMHQMEDCLPNVVVMNVMFEFDSLGRYQDIAHHECLKMLYERPNWNYALLLQNHDMPIKTSREVEKIASYLEGNQDIFIKENNKNRHNKSLDWTAKGMKLWRNESNVTPEQRNAPLHVMKNMNQVFLSRPFVRSILEDIDLTTLLSVLNAPEGFVDEMLFATLASSIELRLPGQSPVRCRNQPFITRWDRWYKNCKSPMMRHSVCILGIEYLQDLSLAEGITANKVWPEFDFAPALCMAELLFNRSHGRAPSSLNASVYTNLPQVRASRLQKARRLDRKTFNCSEGQ